MTLSGLFVAVIGQSGTGKTTVVPLAAQALETSALLEDTAALPAYLAWLENRGSLLDAQFQFLQRAFQLQQQAAVRGGIQERPIQENYEVAVRYYFDRGMLTESDFNSLTFSYLDMCQELRAPDLLVHLTTPPDVLLERRRRRGKPHDLAVSIQDIRELASYYDSMLQNWQISPICSINTASNSPEASATLIESAARELKGR